MKPDYKRFPREYFFFYHGNSAIACVLLVFGTFGIRYAALHTRLV